MKLLDTTVTECTYMGTAIKACGCPTLPGKSYCEEHYKLVYQVGTGRAKRKRDIRVANTVWNIQDAFNEAVKSLEEEGYDFNDERWDVPEDELLG